MQFVGRTRRRILEKVDSNGIGELRWLLDGKVNLDILRGDGMDGRRRRIYGSGTTFLLFLLQVMGSPSCLAMVKHLQACLVVRKRQAPSSSSSAYCQARKRLELPVLKRIFDCLTSFLTRSVPSGGVGRGLKVHAVDGTKVDLADTAANVKKYPKGPKRKRGGSGKAACGGKMKSRKDRPKGAGSPAPEKDRGGLLPKMNLTAVFELSTGGVPAWERSSERVGEQTLWRKLLRRIAGVGTLTLGDAYYCSFGNFAEIRQLGGHAAFIAKPRRIFQGRGRGARDFTVRMPKPKARAKGWRKAAWGKLPDFIEIRIVSKDIAQPGFRPRMVRVATTLLDKEAFPAAEVLGLHPRRWEAELRFRDLKSSIGMDTLACKTPEMIDKELTMHMIAMNLVRALSVDAARSRRVEPSAISFSAALAQSSEWIRMLAMGVFPKASLKRLPTLFMEALADDIVRKRPRRSEPRAVKKRPKPFPPMKTARRNHPQHRPQAA
jgi:hypothetical protein